MVWGAFGRGFLGTLARRAAQQRPSTRTHPPGPCVRCPIIGQVLGVLVVSYQWSL